MSLDRADKPPHYPRPAPIESYGRGGFRFAGMSHRGSLLLLPSGIWAWPVTDASAITAETLAPVFAEADAISLLLIGTGNTRWVLPPDLMQRFAAHGISAETSRTGQAANTFNILLEEGRRVSAALLAVE